MSTKIKIFAGRSVSTMAGDIAKSFGVSLGNVIFNDFADGEFQPSFEENIRGSFVFIIQSTFPPADNLMELLMMVDAAQRASAKNIIAVIPYYGYARQDRKDRPRVSIAAKLVADLLVTAGVNRIITMDLHADQIQGFFNMPVDHLYASSIFIPVLKELDLPALTFASPDTGGTRRAAAYAKALHRDFVICYKQRARPNQVAKMALIGDVKDKDIVLVDDIIDTAGTITKAAELMIENGARSVRAFATHPVFSGPAYERVINSPFDEVYVSDSIPLKQHYDKIKVVSTAHLFAEVIRRVVDCESISTLFEF
ncbi:MAG: ribose-phosphate pyrophosphokinase [Bacteroidales bacterium]|nr:ribose-phosphate pyrophosphokinase [Bacteroidales bacterium]MDD2323077.1 ribose-phosphate pyrophosphokinase [Bacteroidales bacterium]MDD3010251.1 ribose-phosphate pyrophosphokinase [Bacteroidales bacterium]MDD3961983.1 ribose-phosphate pyrophosphokinase [Bacteroidales bacterium]MDY0284904.1 ribose-phosphate pyrophosphokinase [Bacteroidales bacterium]